MGSFKSKNKKIITFFILILYIALLIFSINIIRNNKEKNVKADISNISIKNNIARVKRNSTRKMLMRKIGTQNTVKVYRNNVEVSDTDKIKTNDTLKVDNKEYKVAVIGDINSDGNIDISDISKLYKIYTKKIKPTQVEEAASDTTEDGNINISDLSKLYKMYLNPEEPEILDPLQYNITYNLNGGSNVNNPRGYTDESEAITLKNPTKKGYTFTGWTGSNGTTPQITVTIAKGSTGDKTYTANFKADTYTIKYNLNGGTANNPTTYTIESNTITINNPTKSGYNFAGWTGSNGSTPQMTITIPKGSTGNKEYTASYVVVTVNNDYTIKYNLNGGSNPNNPVKYNANTASFTLKNPTRNGYDFLGWTGSNGKTPQTTVTIPKGSTGNKEYTANFKIKIYKITFDNQGATSAGTKESWYIHNTVRDVTYGGKVYKNMYYYADVNCTNPYANTAITKPTKTGYTFGGYFTGKNGSGTQYVNASGGYINNVYKTAGNKTLYAKWTPNKIKITLNKNGGSGGDTYFWYYYGTSKFYGDQACTREIKSIVKPTRKGYNYVDYRGDGTSGGGKGERYVEYDNKHFASDLATDIYKDATLTATWNIITYKITYNLNKGSANNPTTYNVETNTITLKAPSKTGYDFTGWSGTNLSGNANKTVTIPKGSTGDKSYTANFKPKTVTVTFNSNGATSGTNNQTQTFTYGVSGQTFSKKNLSKKGYTQVGWSDKNDNKKQYSTTSGVSDSWIVSKSPKTTIYASWSRESYSISYKNLNGANNSSNPTSYNVDTPTTILKSISRTGYRFDHWTNVDGLGLSGYTTSKPYNATSRDHALGNEFAVVPGSTVTIYVTAKRTKGNLNMQGGIWYTGKTSGNAYDGYSGEFKKIENLGNGWGRYRKIVIVPKGKSKGKIYVQIEQNASKPTTAWALADITRYTLTSVTPWDDSLIGGSTGNKTFYANWEANDVDLYFDNTNVRKLKVGFEIGTLSTFTEQPCNRFDGWYTQKTGGSKISASTIVPATSSRFLNYYSHTTKMNGNYNGYYCKDGKAYTGWETVNGSKYYYDSGTLTKGWKTITGTWYYFNGNGVMVTGWQKIDNKWYYFKSSGAMMKNRYQLYTDGYYYWLNSDGSSSNVAWKKAYSGDSCWVHKATNSNDYYKSVTYAFSSGDDSKNVGFDSKGWATTCSGW